MGSGRLIMNSYSKTEIFEFLDLVRSSGAVNMYDGAKYLISEYGITRNEAREYLIEWMRTYSSRIHSDKGYEIGTKEGYDAFVAKRNEGSD